MVFEAFVERNDEGNSPLSAPANKINKQNCTEQEPSKVAVGEGGAGGWGRLGGVAADPSGDFLQ